MAILLHCTKICYRICHISVKVPYFSSHYCFYNRL